MFFFSDFFQGDTRRRTPINLQAKNKRLSQYLKLTSSTKAMDGCELCVLYCTSTWSDRVKLSLKPVANEIVPSGRSRQRCARVFLDLDANQLQSATFNLTVSVGAIRNTILTAQQTIFAAVSINDLIADNYNTRV